AAAGVPLRYEVYMSTEGGTLAHRATATLLEDDARGSQFRVSNLEERPYWFWVRGVLTDGTASQWSGDEGVRVDVKPKLGKLAKKDRIALSDIIAQSITRNLLFAIDEKNNVGNNAFETLLEFMVDYPIDPNDPNRQYGFLLLWSVTVPGGATNTTGITIRLQVKNDAGTWDTWREFVRNWPAGHVPRTETGFWASAARAGARELRLLGRTTGDPATWKQIQAAVIQLMG
ncbi:MAG: hypothetical protein NZM12_00965, partial [Steroidobacteraceae bacterium]|nr:hypothetical protein [Steroidobacteraceae bacterium]